MIDIEKILDYLKKKIPEFTKTTKRGQVLFTCPRHSEHKFKTSSATMTIITGTDKFYCLVCGFKGNSYDLIRLVEKKQMSDEEVSSFLQNTCKINEYPELEEYKKYGWSLVPIAKNGKSPIEKDWTNKTHTEKAEWLRWIGQDLNIGIRTGEVSNIIVVDADLKVAPSGDYDEIYKLLMSAKTLMGNTPHGKHFIFKYNKNLKTTTKIAGVTIDIRNDGAQILCSPSRINNLPYNWVNLGSEIKNISEEIITKLLSFSKVDKGRSEEISTEDKKIIDNPIELKGNNLEGCCNDAFVRLGGAGLKMGLPVDKVKVLLHYLNKNWLKNPMPSNVIDAMLGSLEGYKQTEEQTQEEAIYNACELIQTDISAKDILDNVFAGDRKKRAIVDKYLAKFHAEGKLTRRGRGRYDIKIKVEWIDETQIKEKECPYKIPYFNEVARFVLGDMILLGAPTGGGKTHIAMNIIKQMKEQGIKPYYISLESGSRHSDIAEKLGLTQKDYYISKKPIDNPIQIELVENAFTIIDWIYLGDDFAATQSVFKHLSDEVRRKGGILIVFTQLKENYEYFAPNLIKSFPSFAARFIYDSESRELSHWQVDKIRDPLGNYSTINILNIYNFDTKILKIKNNL